MVPGRVIFPFQQTRDAIITPLLRQNDAATSFWRNDDVIITHVYAGSIFHFIILSKHKGKDMWHNTNFYSRIAKTSNRHPLDIDRRKVADRCLMMVYPRVSATWVELPFCPSIFFFFHLFLLSFLYTLLHTFTSTFKSRRIIQPLIIYPCVPQNTYPTDPKHSCHETRNFATHNTVAELKYAPYGIYIFSNYILHIVQLIVGPFFCLIVNLRPKICDITLVPIQQSVLLSLSVCSKSYSIIRSNTYLRLVCQCGVVLMQNIWNDKVSN